MDTRTARLALPFLIGATPLAALSQANAGDLPSEILVRTGDAAPGIDDASFAAFNRPAVGSDGTIGFAALLTGDAIEPNNDVSLWRVDEDGLSLVTLQGQPAAGLNDLRFATFPEVPSIDPNGRIAFHSRLDASDSDDQLFSLWSSDAGTLVPIAMQGQTAPGIPGAVFRGFHIPTVGPEEQVAFLASIDANGADETNNTGIWESDGQTLQLRVRNGDPAPSSHGAVFGLVGRPHTGAPGVLAFRAELTNAPGTPEIHFDNGIWKTVDGELRLLVRDGQLLPGSPHAPITHTESPVINASGDVVFRAFTRPGYASLWQESRGEYTPIAIVGRRAPQTGGAVYAGIGNPQLNDEGAIFFTGSLLQGVAGVDESNNTGFWVDREGVQQLIVRKGDPAPGVPNAVFRQIYSQALFNERGDVVFGASLSPADNPGGFIGSGLWAYSRELDRVLLVVCTGEPIDVSPSRDGSDFRTINSIGTETQFENGSSALNDDGHLLYSLTFDDYTQAILATTIPGPGRCPGDCDGSGDVGFNDLIAQLFLFDGDTPDACDTDGSGDLGFNDLVATLFAFGPCE